MFEIKMRARNLIKGKTALPLFLGVCMFIAYFAGFLCILTGIMSVVYSANAVFSSWKLYPYIQNYDFFVSVFFLGAGVFFIIFAFALKGSINAYFFYSADTDFLPPICSFSLKRAIRESKKTALLLLIKSAWSIFFFSPFCINLIIINYLLKNGVSKNIFVILCVLCLFLFITGAVFLAFSFCRFFLTDYILYLNPKISALEAIRGSILLTQGKMLSILRSKISLIPWKITKLSIFLVPFSYSYTYMITALTCEKYYGENKNTVPKTDSAVTFFINKNTKFHEINNKPAQTSKE